MTQFTPGPWHIGETNKNFTPKVYAKDGYMVADVEDIATREVGEQGANARLIATAPELLGALEAAMDTIENDYLEAKDRWKTLRQRIGSEAYEAEEWENMNEAHLVLIAAENAIAGTKGETI